MRESPAAAARRIPADDSWSVFDATKPPIDYANVPEWTPGSDPNGVYHMSFNERQEARMRVIIREEVALILARLSESAPTETAPGANSSDSTVR